MNTEVTVWVKHKMNTEITVWLKDKMNTEVTVWVNNKMNTQVTVLVKVTLSLQERCHMLPARNDGHISETSDFSGHKKQTPKPSNRPSDP
ncbi:hypothetical protein RRG08_062487 [Elysia crispata]|uniref:Uncharacterized protein n=1 Tax=Elysia crispata TaxID=231223 RepID=A0AAE0YJK4_9GAST|nr:hypothetical protein RRG08_062487 [Elysia crispata]